MLAALERQLPVDFPRLAADAAFTSLIGELMELAESEDLVRRLRLGALRTTERRARRAPGRDERVDDDAEYGEADFDDDFTVDYTPPAWYTQSGVPGAGSPASVRPAPASAATADARRQARRLQPFAGVDILWLDDHPENNVQEVDWLTASGAVIRTVRDDNAADREIALRPPTLLISDLGRGANERAGLDYLARLRGQGTYDGPAVFFTSRVTPALRDEALTMGALDATASFSELRQAVHTVAGRQVRPPR
ncbi:hypothetical protein ABZ721_27735 [Streptomyces sp. NPDC006733]|uniref:hypothetical protein n=1 Tax=Streptomyces sp. NPDC006733 TaxID=3155460 RepID=UPI0033CF0367